MLSLLKNVLVKSAASAIRPVIRQNSSDTRRILVITTTAFGDTLWATPAIESLKKSFPHVFLATLTSSLGMQLLKHNPYIDRQYVIDEPILPKFFSVRATLSSEQFDTILIFHASQRLIFPLAALLGAKKVIGTAGINKNLDSLLTHPLPQIVQHEILRRLDMVEFIGGSIYSETLSFFLQPEERLPKKEGLWVALHPGSKDLFKRWPCENFALVGRALQKRLGCQILITGTKNEESLMRRTAALIPGAHLANPTLSLRSFAALLDQMQLLICNDTGPFHLACALNVPAIGLYAATDPLLCGPHRAPHAIAISKKLSCTPCIKRKCHASFCLLQIGSCEIIDAAITLLA